jgi:lactoylglutathione lyase/glyoxylase I family protein
MPSWSNCWVAAILYRLTPPGYSDLGDSLRYSGYHHFYINVPDIEKAVADLRARGVKIVTEPFKLDAISRKLAFFADPSGNLIELAEIVP